jgi:hypothetical protein
MLGGSVAFAGGGGGSPALYQEFSVNGTYVVPSGVTVLNVMILGSGQGGAGGGGGGSTAAGNAGGGAGGHAGVSGAALVCKVPVIAGETITITIGAGGVGGAGGAGGNVSNGILGTTGALGGDTFISGSFGTRVVACDVLGTTVMGGGGGSAAGGTVGTNGNPSVSTPFPTGSPINVLAGNAGQGAVAGTASAIGGQGGAGAGFLNVRGLMMKAITGGVAFTPATNSSRSHGLGGAPAATVRGGFGGAAAGGAGLNGDSVVGYNLGGAGGGGGGGNVASALGGRGGDGGVGGTGFVVLWT